MREAATREAQQEIAQRTAELQASFDSAKATLESELEATQASEARRQREADDARAAMDARAAELEAAVATAEQIREVELPQWRAKATEAEAALAQQEALVARSAATVKAWRTRAEVATERLEKSNEDTLRQAKLARLNEAKDGANGAERASLSAMLQSSVKSLDDVLGVAEASLLGQRVLDAEAPLPAVPEIEPLPPAPLDADTASEPANAE